MKRQAAIEGQALDWLIRKDEPGWNATEQASLDAWLEESMAHKAAYWRAEHGWRAADRIGSLGSEDHRSGGRRRQARRWWPAAIAASLVAVIGLGTLAGTPEFGSPKGKEIVSRFDTPVGGRKTIPLTDGSKVELNTATVVRTAVGKSGRNVWLDSGEAYFEVAHRAGLPFVVHAGERTITVLGTKFSVRRDRDRVTVNVLEGRVRVEDGRLRDGNRAAIISAGDLAVARGASTLIVTNSEAQVDNALAWRDGMLSFDHTPLSEVAAEFNRYNRKPIIVVDNAAASVRIGGTFQASNMEAFVELLRDAYHFKVDVREDSVQISR